MICNKQTFCPRVKKNYRNSHTTYLFLVSTFIFSVIFSLQGQITVDFTTSKSSGCSPLLVQFINQSSGPGALQFFWNFGNGNTSSLKDPQASYNAPGQYFVTLTVISGNLVNTKTRMITVYRNPDVSFSVDDNAGCIPHEASFIFHQQDSASPVIKWIWDFGDGLMSESVNPVHLYKLPGNFPVSLTVADENGCKGYKVIPAFIRVFSLPQVQFYADQTYLCSDTSYVYFHSTSPSDVSHSWDFANNTYSSDSAPVILFKEDNEFTITLTVTDSNGCSSTEVKNNYIKRFADISVFTMEKDTACKNEILFFQNKNSNADQYEWDFGDGIKETGINPEHSFKDTGAYIITLTASVDNKCSGQYRDTVFIEKIKAGFTESDHFSCETPVSFQYTDQSENAVSWEWRFGNGSTSSEQNPSATYKSSNASTGKNCFFTDKLIVTSAHGCKDTIIKNDNICISLPKAYFTPNTTAQGNPSQLSGCIPLTVNFYDKSAYSTLSDSVISWLWNFGDGQTSSGRNPVHTFTTTGFFNVKLTIFTAKGCESSYKTLVKTGTPQTADFTIETPDTTCAYDAVIFTDLSSDPLLINGWSWVFSDGGMSKLKYPYYQFTDTGSMDATLTVYYNNCPSIPVTKKNIVYVKGPVGWWFTNVDCLHPYTYQFNGSFIDADRFQWNFGDGSSLDSVNINPSHSFPINQNYDVTFTTYNDSNGCSFEHWNMIRVKDIKSIILADTTVGCPGLTVTFDGSQSQDYSGFKYQNHPCNFQWNIGLQTDTFSAGPFIHSFQIPGEHLVRMIVKDEHSCPDTATIKIKIYKPEADFSADITQGCTPLNMIFNNKTISDTVCSLVWYFGDGQTSTDTDSIQHTYSVNGKYSVKLVATDILGCSDSISKTDYIFTSKPKPSITPEKTAICQGDKVHFKNTVNTGTSSWLWNFGDGFTSMEKEPYHIYADTGLFSVSLLEADENGCDSLLIIENLISVQSYPVAQFGTDTTKSNCYPLHVKFSDKTQSPYINYWFWEFGDNHSIAGISNPEHNYVTPGLFSIKYIVGTSNGCKDTVLVNSLVDVGGPFAKIEAPDTACKGKEINIRFTNPQNVFDFLWDLGDGNISKEQELFYSYDRMGYIFPKLMLFSDSMHTCDKYIEDSVFLNMLLSDFSIENKTFCVPASLNIKDQSYGAVSWRWNFGDGDESMMKNPIHLYKDSGNYTIQLKISNDFGCADSLTKTIRIHPLPVISVTNDTLICRGDQIALHATGGKNYHWFPPEYFDADTSANPIATPEYTSQFIVQVSDSNQCETTGSVHVTVQQVPVFEHSSDTSVIIGETAYMHVSSDEYLHYEWYPSTGLNCTDCLHPVVNTLTTQLYTLTVSDTNQCFHEKRNILVKIIEEYTVDVPTAFTPNHDGINDVVYVRGWGVKKIRTFRIFNQWGEQVFETDDLHTGWDGYFKGKLQNSDTYMYYLEAELYSGNSIVKKGDILLIR